MKHLAQPFGLKGTKGSHCGGMEASTVQAKSVHAVKTAWTL